MTSRRVFLVAVLGAMAVAAVAGWQIAGAPPRPADGFPRMRLAILPFDDPASTLDDPFNRALAEAFAMALANADAETFAVVGPTTTARMLAAGLTRPEIAARADADLLLAGGHRESDHSTAVQLITAGGEQILARDFDIDENQPATAPSAIVEAISEAIRRARDSTR